MKKMKYLATQDPEQPHPQPPLVLVWAHEFDEALLAAVEYCCLVSYDVHGVHVRDDARSTQLCSQWNELFPDVPLTVLERDDTDAGDPFLAYVRHRIDAGASHVTIVVSELVAERSREFGARARTLQAVHPEVEVVSLELSPARATRWVGGQIENRPGAVHGASHPSTDNGSVSHLSAPG